MMVEEQKKEEAEEVKPADGAATSSSSINELRYSYDIFLSFRGQDTRHTFTGYLYDALCQRGFNPFIDDEVLERGEQISSSLLKAIEESKVSIVVFSESYASSPWCLDELVKILECKKKRGQKVLPIFYKVEPSDVRHQKNSYEEAMAKHEDRYKSETEKVERWRSALKEIVNLSGWTFNTGYKYKFIKDFIDKASTKLPRQRLCIGEHIVGLESCLKILKSILEVGSRNNFIMVGIHGTGGMGKTTLAKVLYNLIVDQFDKACFLESVREKSNNCLSLLNLQEALLSHMFGKKNFNLGNVDEGVNEIKNRLCNRRVLLVLDDIDKKEQLEKLAGAYDWFGPGSRIIITTRDMHLLRDHQVDKTYKMKKLNDGQALELFCWNAFKRNHPDKNFVDISNRMVRYAMGLPLALKVIGSDLFHKNLEVWKSALDQYERIPNKDIQGVLRVSYDSLECNQKAIFLDIACFLKGERLEYVEQILDACDLSAKYGIQVLVDKSLIVNQDGTLQMHDLIQRMGREVVRGEAPSKLGERSRLWYHEDVIRVLTENSATDNMEGIMLDLPQRDEIQWSGTAFEKLNNLRILIVRNAYFSTSPKHLPNNLRFLDWEEYPSKFLPKGFYPRMIGVLKLCSNHLRLTKSFQKFEKLTCMDLSGSQQLTLIPDMARAPNLGTLKLVGCTNLKELHDSVGGLTKLLDLNLERCANLEIIPDMAGASNLRTLRLVGCTNLKEVHDSVGGLTKLHHLNLEECTNLEIFPHGIRMTSLRYLNLKKCRSLQHFPDILEPMVYLERINAEGSGIKEIPHSICYLRGLEYLYLSDCYDLVSLPESIDQLHILSQLTVSNCKRLPKISRIPPYLSTIRAEGCISLTSESFNALRSQKFKQLTIMNFSGCQQLTQIPDMAGTPNLDILCLEGCTNLKVVHDSVGGHTKLLNLNLAECTNLEIFPHGIRMTSLRFLYLKKCRSLQHFPDILEPMVYLECIDAQGSGIKQIPHSIRYLPGLRYLYLSDCYDLVSLPESIFQLDRLETLDIGNRKKLPEISKVTPRLSITRADGSISLTSESSNTLWSKAQREMISFIVSMPTTHIPNWFDHRCKGGSLSFWTRRKFPWCAFAVVFRPSTNKISSRWAIVEILGYNDGYKTLYRRPPYFSGGGGTFLLPLPKSVTNFNAHDWNDMEIKCRMLVQNYEIDKCGVYIYKQDINMEDIQFECPIPHNSNTDTKVSREDEEVRDKIEEGKPRKRSHTELMSRNDENIHEVKARKKPCRVKSRNGKLLEADKLPRRFIKKSVRKRLGINSGWRRQVLPPFFSKLFKLSSSFHSI